MKIVVQDGKNVGKQELEVFLVAIPGPWKELFDTVVVYASLGDTLKVTHHEKERVLGIHCPRTYKGTSVETLEEVAIYLAALHDFGHMPKKISASRREHYLSIWLDHNAPNQPLNATPKSGAL